MTREAFRELVKKGPVLLDGATGTNLQKAGMPVGVCPQASYRWAAEDRGGDRRSGDAGIPSLLPGSQNGARDLRGLPGSGHD